MTRFPRGMRSPVTLVVGLMLAVESASAQVSQHSEYQLKAAYIYNFAQFIDWPPAAFANDSSPLVIAILGANPFGGELEQTIQGKNLNRHPLTVKEVRSPSEATNNCHILFISLSEKKRLPEIFSILRGTSVLTVGETEWFTETGGMINFVLVGTKIRFQINAEAAKRAGLKISSKLLNLASRPEH
jgi:hypothetical protein